MLNLGGASFVSALGDLLHNLLREGFEIAWVTGRHDPLVSHDLHSLPFGSGIDHVCLDRLVRGCPPPLDDIRLDEEPGGITDSRHDLSLIEEGTNELQSLV